MSAASRKRYTLGTHRIASPEETLERIAPHLRGCGITRCADVTALDRIGIPVYCAMRPDGRALQVSNGKGVTHAGARVSALMEAIELFHAENPPALRRARASELREERELLEPCRVLRQGPPRYWSDEFVVDWTEAQHLGTGATAWVPASAAYLCWPAVLAFDSNGLASGNDRVEATLHALYEVIEHDAISRLSDGEHLDVRARCRRVALGTIDDPGVTGLCERIARAGAELVLLWVPSCIVIHTFWAILLDEHAFASASMIRMGSGTHLSPAVAASRAITEAAQARLTAIHGAREDLGREMYADDAVQRRLARHFRALPAIAAWRELPDDAGDDLAADYDRVLERLRQAGFDDAYLVDMTRAPFGIPVVKVVVPGLLHNERIF